MKGEIRQELIDALEALHRSVAFNMNAQRPQYSDLVTRQPPQVDVPAVREFINEAAGNGLGSGGRQLIVQVINDLRDGVELKLESPTEFLWDGKIPVSIGWPSDKNEQ